MKIVIQVWDQKNNWLGSASCSSSAIAIRFGVLLEAQGLRTNFEVSDDFSPGTITEGQILDLKEMIAFHERQTPPPPQ